MRTILIALALLVAYQAPAIAKPPRGHGHAQAAADTLFYESVGGEVAFPAPPGQYDCISIYSHLGAVKYKDPVLGIYQDGSWVVNVPALTSTNRPGPPPFTCGISSVRVPEYVGTGVEFRVKLYPDLDNYWGNSPDLPAPRWVAEVDPR